MPPPSQSQSHPPSIWGQPRLQGHKATGSAPISLATAPGISRSTSANGKMPPSFRDRGGKLQAFVRGNSEGIVRKDKVPNDQSPSHARIQERAPNPPRAIAPIAIRQAPVEAARIPPTQNGRFTAPPERTRSATHQAPFAPPKSPPLSGNASPTIRAGIDSRENKEDLFAGSQLGESFMESGLTTPTNEPAEPIVTKPEPMRNVKSYPLPPPTSTRYDVDGRPTKQDRDAEFSIGDDGRMSIVQAKSRYNPMHMKDGFQNGTVDGPRKSTDSFLKTRQHAASSFEPQPKPPLREIKIRRSHNGGSTVFAAEKLPRSPSPAPKKPTRQTSHPWENDRQLALHPETDDEIESQADEDLQTTPRPKKVRPVPQRNSMESPTRHSRPTIHLTRDRKRRRGSFDYDDRALSSMKFEDLQRQSFDFDPSKALEHRGGGSESDGLADKLEQCSRRGPTEQTQLFSSMSIEDWEASGEWFSHKFMDMMESLRKLRQRKRQVIQQFENEAAQREETVRLRTEAIDRKLNRMKQDGQRVVEDRCL